MRSYEMFWNKQEEGKIAEASHKEGKQKEVNTRLYMLTGIWRDCVCVCVCVRTCFHIMKGTVRDRTPTLWGLPVNMTTKL